MNKIKKFISICLIGIMTISNVTPVLAEEDYSNVEVINAGQVENVQPNNNENNEGDSIFDLPLLRYSFITGKLVGEPNNGYASMDNGDIAFCIQEDRTFIDNNAKYRKTDSVDISVSLESVFNAIYKAKKIGFDEDKLYRIAQMAVWTKINPNNSRIEDVRFLYGTEGVIVFNDMLDTDEEEFETSVWYYVPKDDKYQILVSGTAIAKSDIHVHTLGQPVKENEIAATCKKEGSFDEVVYCSSCGEELSREKKVVDKLDHVPGEAKKENEKVATCTEGSYYDNVVRCKNCGDIISSTPVQGSALGHKWNNGVVTTAATCEKAGVKTFTCDRCQTTRTEAINKLQHTAGTPVKENEIAATEEVDGSYEEVTYCTKCGAELSRTKITVPKISLKETYLNVETLEQLGYNVVEESTYDRKIFKDNEEVTSLDVPATFVYNGEKYKIVGVGYRTFYHCGNLKSITLPDTVTEIGEYAFSCCGLESITIPDSVTSIYGNAFSGCPNLVTVDMSKNLKTLEYRAFSNCTSLRKIELPNTLEYVSAYLFAGCDAIESVGPIGSEADVILPRSIAKIYQDAFASCDSLKTVDIISSVATMGKEVFYSCKALTDVTISRNVKTIDEKTFYECTSLKNVNLPKGLKNIGPSAFSKCTSLKTIVFPDSLATIGAGAFYNCSSLETAIMSEELTTIGKQAFDSCYKLKYTDLEKTGNFIAPNKLTTIGEAAFRYCRGFTSLVCPESVTTIGKEAFYSCTGLKTVTVSDKLKNLGSYAFSSCTSLSRFNTNNEGECFVPNTIESIGEYAFSGCNAFKTATVENGRTRLDTGLFCTCIGLESVKVPENITEVGYYVFANCRILSRFNSDIEGHCVIPSTLKVVTEGMFQGCAKLTDVVFPENATKIGQYAFQGCSSLTEIIIPDSVEEIGWWSFTACSKAETIKLPNSQKIYFSRDFDNCTSVKHVIVPEKVTFINGGSFVKCKLLQKVTFKDTNNWFVSESNDPSEGGTNIDVSNAETNASKFRNEYQNYCWHKR